MTFSRLLLRNLRFHARGNLAVLLGVLVGAAVLTGALLVGDSLRGSLRDLAGEQLGWVDQFLVGGRFLREELADHLPARHVAPAVVMQTTVHWGEGDETRRVGHVKLFGVDDRFWPGTLPPGGTAWCRPESPDVNRGEVVLNAAVARALDVQTGDQVRVSLHKASAVPRETLLGRREVEDVLDNWTLTVRAILEEHAPGDRFSLNPGPASPRNAYVPLRLLQARLGQTGRVNAFFTQGSNAEALQSALKGRMTLEDWGLVLRDPAGRTRELFAKLDRNRDGKLAPSEWRRRVALTLVEALRPGRKGDLEPDEVRDYFRRHRSYLSLESRNMLLEPAAVRAAEAAARDTGLRATPTLVYLANRIAAGNASIPYSVVAALDPLQAAPLGPFSQRSLEDDEILLADWEDSPLKAQPGDAITLTYFLPDERGGLREAQTRFRLAGTVPLQGPAADPDLTPEFPGITDKLDIKEWNPPFPYDNKRIRKEDEQFWEQHRTTPKAYITFQQGVKLWGGRFGDVTSIRLAPPEGSDPAEAAAHFEKALLVRLDPEQGGLAFDDVRRRALEAGAGGLDFGGLFLGFSFFLIAAALLLVGLLFRLNLERRAGEVGLLLATGYRRRTVRNLLLAEGTVLALLGSAIGCAAALGYAWLLLEFLRSWWPGSLEGSFLRLHVGGASLLIGYGAAVAISLATIAWGVRMLGQLAPSALLAGQTASAHEMQARRTAGWASRVARASAALGLVLLVAGNWVRDHEAQAGTFFGGGALLLTAGLAAAAACLRRNQSPSGKAVPSLAQLGRRNAARHRTRSLLTAGLLASAAFLVVAVESFRRDPGRDYLNKDAGSGGYDLYAETALPIFQDLNTEAGRAELNFPPAPMPIFANVAFQALRLRAGDDASCLNLANPRHPRLLGVPANMLREGGFRFAETAESTPEEQVNPWRLLERTFEDGTVPVFGEKNSVAWMLKSGVGGTVEVQDERGQPVKLRIVGLLQDSVFQDGLLMSEANFLRLFPGHAGYNVFLVRLPGEQAPTVKAALNKGLASQGWEATPSTERLAMYLAVENTYLSTFQLLGGLGLLLGALGLAVVLLRGVWERRGELALLRALGFRSRALGWLLLAENGLLLALGLGVGTAAAVLAVLPHAAGGSTIPWVRLTILLALVVLVGLAAGVAAIASSLRAPLIPALRRE